MSKLTAKEKAELAIQLIRRSCNGIQQLAEMIEQSTHALSGFSLDETKFNWSMNVLKSLNDLTAETTPDDEWFPDYCTLTGEYWHLTEEGWVPARFNTKAHTGYEPMEVLDEVNAPEAT